ncbi:hypothetical protein RD792_015881 [Penstemon davidsonii]|uniref:Calmodulin-binding protein n=1 Tax=Penstemon davidsonii TaxID=160366 RepID=A0ABR0CJN5_9LAMI|nr:hypothetical protein RD792_015881 [Penstemon davidsonii]
MKRRSDQGEEEYSEHHPNKQRHLPPILFDMQEFVSSFEPIFRKLAREEMDGAFDRFLRNSRDQASAGSRTLQLQFHSNLPSTLYTGNRVVSDSDNPVKIVLYDSISRKTVTSGPLSSIKVRIVALDSEFEPDDRKNWTREEFEEKIIESRQGKRPLVTGDLVVTLRDGVGYVGDVSFTDNSSWMRSGKFRLGSKAHTNSDYEIREGISNSFRVKDHRGESYQKHYPPSSDDQVWRLEKIGKEGASHRKLTRHGIFNVGDFLRLYFTDQSTLRAMLNISNRKNWDAIIGHAITCTLADDNKYMYKMAQGTTGLLFNSVYKNIGVTFDGQSYQSVDNLNIHHKKIVEDLKRTAYRNINDWVPLSHSSAAGYPLLLGSPAGENFNLCPQDTQFQNQDQRPYNNNREVEQQNSTSSFEIGESSHHQVQAGGFDFKDSFGMMNDSTTDGMFYTWAADNEIVPVDDRDFQVESSLWQGGNPEIGIMSSSFINPGILTNPNNGSPKTSWWKILAVVKWRILARRNVAARKWKRF